MGVVLNDLEFKSAALNSQYFGTNRYFYGYNYNYSKQNQPQTWGGKIISLLKKPKEKVKRTP
jgi:hypothetical protein